MTTIHQIARMPLCRLAKGYRQRWLRQAVRRAYLTFARQHPMWADSLFDEHFLMYKAMPLLHAYLDGQEVDDAALASAWAEQIGYPGDAVRQHLITQSTLVASAFLTYLEKELPVEMRNDRPLLKSNVDNTAAIRRVGYIS